ncbi:MAG: hypothetical protein RLQ12_21900 [Cyclobacteriaceae bacterium]
MKRIYILILVIICSPFTSFGQTEFSLNPIGDYLNGFAGKGSDLFEVGAEFNKKELTLDKLYLKTLKFGTRVPVDEDDNNQSRVDKSTDNFNIVGGAVFKKVYYNSNDVNSKYNTWEVAPDLEWGRRKYKYESDSIKGDADETWKTNFAAEIKGKFFHDPVVNKGFKFAIFGRIRYSNSNKASDPIGLLNPANNVVSDLVVSEPKTTRIITPAVGANMYFGSKAPISFAPVFYYYFEDKDTNSDFEKERFRAEQWLYFYPYDEDNLGIRFGIGLFQDVFTDGKTADDENLFGIVVGIKSKTNILESVF